jgi:hypothetical protein
VDDFATVKYSASGEEQWAIRHSDDGEVYNIASAIGLDGSGGVYVTGSSTRLGGRLFTTVKYAQETAAAVGGEFVGPRGGYALDLAGPNPFQRSTMVRYSLGGSDHIRLKVFNARGEEVATLVDGIRGVGTGAAEWDATAMPSGIYFFRLEAGTAVVDAKKVVLLR